MDDYIRDDALVKECRHTLDKFPKAKVVPRQQNQWPAYLRYLRSDILDLSQDTFWGLLGVKKVTGSKYENLRRGRYGRNLPLEKMNEMMELFGLEWETFHRFGTTDDNGRFRPTEEARSVLELIERFNVSLQDLEALVTLHRHYNPAEQTESDCT